MRFKTGVAIYPKPSSEFEKPMALRDIFVLMHFLNLRVGYERSFLSFLLEN